MKVILCIPTLNAARTANILVKAIKDQTWIDLGVQIIDSDSTDDTEKIFKELGCSVHTISKTSFNHGATRQLALSLCPEAEFLIYMTQDSILASPDSIIKILSYFEDNKIGAVCGRQLPHFDASPIASHARKFNYPEKSVLKSKNDIQGIGIKAAFISNSFTAYRRLALMEVGGFPSDVICSEDNYVAAKMLLAGWTVAYCAEAICYHSHNYNIVEEFRRYFDIGVFHSREEWIIKSFGKPEEEGKKFVISEMRYLLQHAPWLIPSAVVRTGLKLIGYKLGQREQVMPLWIKRKLSMNKGFWKNE
ncbi:MAG: glycosyltransferase family 2 protein [Desulfuromonadales bacterium]|nr:glycosyltransferase family 2 protein [Desulfuromonadales bacterium]